MPAISVSMRGTNWLSGYRADFTDREILTDRPSAPRLLFVRVLCGIVPAASDLNTVFRSICTTRLRVLCNHQTLNTERAEHLRDLSVEALEAQRPQRTSHWLRLCCAVQSGVICGLGFGKTLLLPDHFLRPEHRPLGADALIRPVPFAH